MIKIVTEIIDFRSIADPNTKSESQHNTSKVTKWATSITVHSGRPHNNNNNSSSSSYSKL